MPVDPTEPLKAALRGLRQLKERVAVLEGGGAGAPVAIVGMACRFPGGAHDPDAFFADRLAGRDVVGPIPDDRFDTQGIVAPRGGFLDDVLGFDAAAFRTSPREARAMDPQQRLLLEVAWEALEDAAVLGEVEGSRTGVYVGLSLVDWAERTLRRADGAVPEVHDATGVLPSVAAGRIAHHLGLTGPALAVDTACSSSLVAVHLAAQALRDGDCELALAGGVNLLLAPDASRAFSAMGALSPTGACHTFDARADGYVRSEGVGVAALARLDVARARGLRVLGVLRGSAVGHDGLSAGLTVPSGPAQEAVIRRALARAEVAPEAVGFVETHGTGTPLGDPIEVGALARVYGAGPGPVRLGAVKSQIGHAETAAGVAGLLVAVQALRTRCVPGLPDLGEVNPRLPLDGTGLVLPRQGESWDGGVAAVSSFGLSGTHAHLVLTGPEEAAQTAADGPRALVLSARDADALAVVVEAARARLAEVSLEDAAWTAAAGRAALPWRVAVVAEDAASAAEALGAASFTGPVARTEVVLVVGEEAVDPSAWLADPDVQLALEGAGLETDAVRAQATAATRMAARWVVARAVDEVVPAGTVVGCGEGAWAAAVLVGAVGLAEAVAGVEAGAPVPTGGHRALSFVDAQDEGVGVPGALAIGVGRAAGVVLDASTLPRDRADLLASLWLRGAHVRWPQAWRARRVAWPRTPWRHEVFDLPDPRRRPSRVAARTLQWTEASLEPRARTWRPVTAGRRGKAVAAMLSQADDGLPLDLSALDKADVAATLGRAVAARAAGQAFAVVVPEGSDGAAVAAACRAFAAEAPAAWAGLVEVAGAPAARIAEALERLDGRDLRVGETLETARWVAAAAPEGRWAPAEGTWWITGGTGGLGRALAARLADRGVGHLVLLARRPPGEAAVAAIEALRARGVRVDVVEADVTDEGALAAAVAAHGAPVGVVHAAGQVDDRPVDQVDAAAIDAAARPKAGGLRTLLSALPVASLDRLVVVGSATDPLGVPGQAAYAAADARMLADATKARGIWPQVIGVRLGPVDVGMGAATTGLATLGATPMPVARALDALEGALAADAHGVALLDLDAERWATAVPGRSGPLLGQVVVSAPPPTVDVETAVRAAVARALGVDDPAALDASTGFFDLGLDSMTATALAADLAVRLRRPVPPTAAFDHPSVQALVAWARGAPAVAAPRPAAEADTAVAVVGFACRFPGGVASPEDLWALLLGDDDPLGPVPADRWDAEAVFDPQPGTPGRSYVRDGGFVDDVLGFDAEAFGIGVAEAELLDPQQRLLLEVGTEALERAAVPVAGLRGQAVGVFVGAGPSDYALRVRAAGRADEVYAGTGSEPSFAAGRLAYHLGVEGPVVGLDTACSSALVAVDLAARALREGSCRLALAAGVQLQLAPDRTVQLCQLRALSPTGRCHSFDARADGYVRAEGCGVVVLERLDDARRLGHPVLAVIRASGVGHDGAGAGLTVPHGAAQARLLGDVVARAGVAPADVGFLETHGTGTVLGDPVELGAVVAAYGDRPADRPLRLGAVKSHLGHTEAAAGMAGLGAALLALEHGVFPGVRHLGRPNPALPAGPYELSAFPRPWTGDGPRLAAVSSFGLSGTNAHLVLQAGEPVAAGAPGARTEHPLLLSAAHPEAVVALAARVAEVLDAGAPLADVAYTLAVGRSPRAWRAGVVAGTGHRAAAALRALTVEAVRKAASDAPEPGGDGLAELVAAWVAGAEVDVAAWWAGEDRRLRVLPPTPWVHRQLGLGPVDAGSRSARAPDGARAARPRLAPDTDLEQLVREVVAGILGDVAPGSLDASRGLVDQGLDSLGAVQLARELAARTGQEVPDTVVFDEGTIEGIVARLAGSVAPAPLASGAHAQADPVVIVGMACRLPGGADDPEGLWALLTGDGDGIVPVPADRWDADALHDPTPGTPGRTPTRRGGFLEDVAGFEPLAFGIAPREARFLDPQQRLLLEVAWEALEDAGVAPDRLRTSATAVILGIGGQGWLRRVAPLVEDAQTEGWAGLGNDPAFAAGRIAHLLGARGPALVLDTACSTSLVALHLGARALRDGEADLALVGGVRLQLDPDDTVRLSALRALSPTDRSRPFDAAADGFVRADGCAVLVLERLSQARARGHRVLAEVVGSAVGHDGPSSGLTAPSGAAQRAVIRAALADAGLAPADVDAVETHGTGTPLGDPIEAGALAEVFADRDRPLRLGALKARTGHAELAAGAAGVVAAVLALRHETWPGIGGLQTPNPALPASPDLALSARATPWPADHRRVVGVSAFGLSGTNAHVLLADPPVPPPSAPEPAGPELLVVSATTEAGLEEAGQLLARTLARTRPVLADVAWTLATGRARRPWRRAVQAADLDAAIADLRRGGAGVHLPAGAAGPDVAWVFTGQGAQHVGMGLALDGVLPAFTEVWSTCDALMRDLRGVGLREVVAAQDGRLDRTAWTQPALYALQVALAAQWRALGVRPAVVLGHSVGELAAATVAGLWSVEDGLRVAEARGRLMDALPEGGAMVAVRAAEGAVRGLCGPHVELAALNAPDEVVLSGHAEAVDAAVAKLAAQGVSVARLPVSHAFHSAAVDPMLDELEDLVAGLPRSVPSIPLVSAVTGRVEGEGLRAPRYWRRQAREAVRFAAAVRAVPSVGAWLELGPQPVLLGLAGRTLGTLPAAVPSLQRGRPDREVLQQAVAALLAQGVDVDPAALHAPGRRTVSLPSTRWRRERLWVEATRASAPTLVERFDPVEPRARRGTWWVGGSGPDRMAAVLGAILVRHDALPEGTPDGVLWRVGFGNEGLGLALRGLLAVLDALTGRGAVDVPVHVAVPASRRALARAVAALLRVVAWERPGLAGATVELGPEAGNAWVGALGLEEDVVRVDQGRLTARRLVAVQASAPRWTRGAVLVTGGTGAVGRAIAQRALDGGAQAVVLLARTPRSVDVDVPAGAVLEVVAGDVATDRGVAAALDAVARTGVPLRAVVHAAGVLRDTPLAELAPSTLQETLAPKATGVTRLVDALRARGLLDELEALVLASSATAWLGAPGQGAYAVANGWLDGTAESLRAEGVPATSVAWGPWTVGMAAEHGEAMALRGARPMPPERAVEALLVRSEPLVAVVEGDWGRLREHLARGRRAALLDALTPVAPPTVGTALVPVTSPAGASALSVRELEQLARRVVGEVLGIDDPARLAADAGLAELGLDSLSAVQVAQRLGEHLGRSLPATLAFDHPSLARLARFLAGASASPAVAAAGATAAGGPVAIVGLACRFPGAPDADAFWRVLVEGRCTVGEAPDDRWPHPERWFDPTGTVPGRSPTKAGAFLDDIAGFDPLAFRIAPRAAEAMDPQQRLVLEVVHEALADAAILPDALRDRRVAVMVGIGGSEYGQRFQHPTGGPHDAHAGVGNDASLAAGRVAHGLGTRGPAVSLDTACSSSLVALHLARRALLDGEAELAVVAGVNLLVVPESHARLAALGALSPTGLCRTFDAAADGYVRGEGAGAVILAPLEVARARGLRVHAVLRGSAVGHDGASSGLTVPSGPAQTEVLRAAWASAGIGPDDLGFVEVHGTGTPLGDPIEAAALGEALEGRTTPLPVGSVKTNLGHLEVAAGMAGLLKVVLALRHGQVPAHLHLREANPRIPDDLPLVVPTSTQPWSGPRVAGVSAFGLSGTNAHVVIEGVDATRWHRRPVREGAWALPLAAHHRRRALAGLVEGVALTLAGHGAARGRGVDGGGRPVRRATIVAWWWPTTRAEAAHALRAPPDKRLAGEAARRGAAGGGALPRVGGRRAGPGHHAGAVAAARRGRGRGGRRAGTRGRPGPARGGPRCGRSRGARRAAHLRGAGGPSPVRGHVPAWASMASRGRGWARWRPPAWRGCGRWRTRRCTRWPVIGRSRRRRGRAPWPSGRRRTRCASCLRGAEDAWLVAELAPGELVVGGQRGGLDRVLAHPR
ncbi:MAG: SDR family NAD(P)-dependent oxidoreductase [Alphaproteobacteria bacterium]|nr:SDR family NAD(P)-dependent oxidoreductase [Alphaproteobacteria bacterium]